MDMRWYIMGRLCIYLMSPFFFSHAVSGQIPTQFYHSEHFGINEGLGHGVIADFNLDQEGVIWLNTVQGLQQFDGHQFRAVASPTDQPAQLQDLSFSHSGYVFFVTQDALVNLQHPDTLADYPVQLDLPSRGCYHQGKTYILYESRSHLFIHHCSDTIFQIRKADMTIERRFLLPVAQNRFYMLKEFDIDFALPDHYEYIGDDEKLYRYNYVTHNLDTIIQLNKPSSVIKLGTDLYASIEYSQISIFTTGSSATYPLPEESIPAGRKCLLRISDQHILVILTDGIYEFDFIRRKWTGRYTKTGLGTFYDSHIRDIQIDQDGNIYLSTFTTGLVKLYPRNPGFQYLGVNEKEKRFVRNITGSDVTNIVLMGTLQHGLYAFDTLGNVRMHFMEFPDKDPNPYIKGIIKVSPYRFYILGHDIHELNVTADHIDIRKVKPFPQNWYNFYSGVMPGHDRGTYFMPSWQGLLKMKPGHQRLQTDFIYGHPIQRKYAFDVFRGGYLAAGEDSLLWLDAGADKLIQVWDVKNLGFIRCVLTLDDRDVLLGSDVGLFRISLTDTAIITEHLYDKMVYAILPDSKEGVFWFTTDYGIFKIDEHNELTQYSVETGVQDNEFNSNVRYMSESGKMYFGGINGITSFYPEAVTNTTDHIRVRVATVSVNHREVARYLNPDTPYAWTFTNAESNIGVELIANGRRSPRAYNYQYRLSGGQGQWVNMGRDPRIQFHLPPGHYTFQYYAGDQFDPDAEALGEITWSIRPPFFRQTWFILLASILVCSIVYTVYRAYRKRRELKIRYEYQIMERIQSERVRISRELHDNIGAQMATVKRNLSFLVQNRHRLQEEQVTEKMENLETISTQINQELRDTIWAVQHESISIGDFINRFKGYVFQVVKSDEGYRVHYEEKGQTDTVLSPFVALNLHRICQEAINNIIKHADANTIRIEFESESDLLHISISDNGKGIDLHAKPFGYGLSNMRQRADQINAQLYIESNTLGGTTIRIVLPSIRKNQN